MLWYFYYRNIVTEYIKMDPKYEWDVLRPDVGSYKMNHIVIHYSIPEIDH